MTVIAFTDGASRGNPGESGIGIILKDETGNVLFSGGGYLGKATNNTAEYQALIACLKKAYEIQCEKLVVHSDSELMVRQMQGTYKIKDKNLQRYAQEVRKLVGEAAFTFEIKHIAREENHDADMLANAGIDSRQTLRI